MSQLSRFRLVPLAALAIAGPAAAQTYGTPPSYPPGPGVTWPGQAPQPSAQPFGQPAAGPSIVGSWSGQNAGPAGVIQQADAFSPDGRFVSVARLPNGFLARAWGDYRTTPVSANQLRLEVKLQGWLPQEVCQQMAGGQPQCQPFQVPTGGTYLVTFGSPDQLQSVSETSADGGMLNEVRTNQPALLQAQAPQRWITVVQPSPAPNPAPYPSPTPYPSPSYGRRCDDLQQRRICTINGGRLVSSGGCLTCVTD